MALHLTLASLYVVEYRKHLADGLEPYDALLATARGELELSPSKRDALKAVIPPAVPKPK